MFSYCYQHARFVRNCVCVSFYWSFDFLEVGNINTKKYFYAFKEKQIENIVFTVKLYLWLGFTIKRIKNSLAAIQSLLSNDLSNLPQYCMLYVVFTLRCSNWLLFCIY